MSQFDFSIENVINKKGDVMMLHGEINVYSDASFGRKNPELGCGGGGVVLIPESVTGTKDEMVLFSVRFPNIFDINEAEAEMAATIMAWINGNYQKTSVNFYLDSQEVIRRSNGIILGNNPTFCTCDEDGAKSNFLKNKRITNICQTCGGHTNEENTSRRIHERVSRFAEEVIGHKGYINVSHVTSHAHCWGNNYADVLANQGRKMEGTPLEMEFS